jgi:hypothetical protein
MGLSCIWHVIPINKSSFCSVFLQVKRGLITLQPPPKKGLGHGNTHHLFPAKTSKTTPSVTKSTATIFWDHKGVLLVDFWLWWHCNYSTLLWYTVAASRHNTDGNMSPHMTNWTSNWVWCHGWEIMDHPPYSPDLMPIDLLQVPKWSKLSLGCTCLMKIFSVLGYKLWYHSGTNGEIVNGDYVDIWCVPSATSVPSIQSNENKVLGIHCLLAYFLNSFVQFWLLETFLHSSHDHLSCPLLSYTVNSLVI